ncbi:MAG TPA: Ig-like domain-containing protein [Vicinamibacterales bacterium]|nr:Ig-like domain-containing protein [Vicinamibacterales bacterium]
MLAATAPVAAQPPPRLATTIESLLTFPVFYHGRPIVVRGVIRHRPDAAVLSTAGGTNVVPVVTEQALEERRVELRGTFWDVGRLPEGDPRVAGRALDRLLEQRTGGRWPGQGQLHVIAATEITEITEDTTSTTGTQDTRSRDIGRDTAGAERGRGEAGTGTARPPASVTLRAIALEPERFEGRRVTVAGRFRGFNLYGDLPQAPGRSRWDFVLLSGEGAVWVTGLRPRGQGFDLNPRTRIDTGRWLQVTGTVRHGRGLVWIEAEGIALADEPPSTRAAQPSPPQPGPPPLVLFSVPLPGDEDVDPGIAVRLQFSRDMDAASFKGRVRATYPGSDEAPPQSTAVYRPENRSLEIRFAAPLARFRTVRIDLLEGITATDGAPLAPWSLTFTTGGR